VLQVDGELDHDALFPALGLAVHHGGAGTFAAALRAGVPSVIVPAGVDSHYWQRRCEAVGVGPRAPSLLRATPAALVRVIEAAAADPGLRERAAAVAASLAGEQGAETAADHVGRLLERRAGATPGSRRSS
jgi:UDP:flavonoid glycosyltransferase YjiC (YdhE family)